MFMTGVLCTVCGAQVYFFFNNISNNHRYLSDPDLFPMGDVCLQFLFISNLIHEQYKAILSDFSFVYC